MFHTCAEVWKFSKYKLIPSYCICFYEKLSKSENVLEINTLAVFALFGIEGVCPDMVTLGKQMGNGHPVGGLITTKSTAKKFAATGIEYFNTVSYLFNWFDSISSNVPEMPLSGIVSSITRMYSINVIFYVSLTLAL